MRGATPLVPQYAFMAWCSVKAQGQLYFFTFIRPTTLTVKYEKFNSNLSHKMRSV